MHHLSKKTCLTLLIFLSLQILVFAQKSQQALNEGWTFQDTTGQWLPAKVPGCIHTDLLDNNRIEDPFYGKNEAKLQWISDRDWQYRTQFNVNKNQLQQKHTELVFKGLDTYADVFLNDSLILQANNMFLEWRVDVKKYLKEGKNTLRIKFTTPLKAALPDYNKLPYKLPGHNDDAEVKVSMFTRKAPYQYGWDWGPRYITAGVWRPIVFETWNDARIENTHVLIDKLDSAQARLTARVEIWADQEIKGEVKLRCNNQDYTIPTLLRKGSNTVPVRIIINQPQLWWPNGLGKQYLYPINISLAVNGQNADKATERVGLRTVQVKHEWDKDGKSFAVIVNGKPAFMKGANYIPADNFMNRVSTERYEKMLQSTVDANMNMLRVWGGGIYEEDKFYDLCDEKGILIWQDFMFSCSMYPGDAKFMQNVTEEAIQNVKRLRNHASLALWCGNNEMEWGWRVWGFWHKKYKWTTQDSVQIWDDYKRLFQETLPAICKQYDPGRFYTRSSPSANEDDISLTDKKGISERHDWVVWFSNVYFDQYKKSVSRFVSEYGFQAFPSFSTIQKFTKPSDWEIESEVMQAHQKHKGGNGKIKRYMDKYYKIPQDFQKFIYVSQLLQGDAIKMAVETHRRNMPYCMGSLYWQLNDCWPVVSWSSIDYYNNWKALQYYARRFNNNILVSPTLDKDTMRVFVVSDQLKPIQAQLTVAIRDFNGKTVSEHKQAIQIKANTSEVYLTKPLKELINLSDTNTIMMVASITSGNQVLNRNEFYFTKFKNLQLPKPQVKAKVLYVKDGQASVELRTDKLAKSVYISANGVEDNFSDNFFDLLPNEKIVVQVKVDKKLNAKTLEKNLKVTTLTDTY